MCLEFMDTDLKDPFICEVYERKRKTFEKRRELKKSPSNLTKVCVNMFSLSALSPLSLPHLGL